MGGLVLVFINAFAVMTTANPPQSPYKKGGSAARDASIRTELSSLFKRRVEQGFRVACHSPAERYSGASEYAACKAGGIFGG